MEKNSKAGNGQAQDSSARDLVYDLRAGSGDSAEVMYRRLRLQGFTPEWHAGSMGGGITLPQNETSKFRELQKLNPATWGNHPDVQAVFDKNKLDTKPQRTNWMIGGAKVMQHGGAFDYHRGQRGPAL